MDSSPRVALRMRRRLGTRLGTPAYGCLLLALGGCMAFNSSFLALFDSTGGAAFQTLPNPPGHVVVGLINQTEFDERLLTYLEGLEGMADIPANAKPRIRLRVRITYVDGTFRTVEFIDGTANIVDPEFDAQAFPDLNQNELNNAVVLCDVASVQLEPGSSVEVFLPASILQFQLVETQTEGGAVDPEFELRGEIAPQFWELETDTVDEDGNVILPQNIGVRDVLSPTPNVICGSVVAITVSGTLALPFLEEESPDAPSFDIDDEETEARIGGRYEFIVTVQ